MVDDNFGFEIPLECPGVPSKKLVPKKTWEEPLKYEQVKAKLIKLFQKNFKKFEADVNPAIVAAGPKL